MKPYIFPLLLLACRAYGQATDTDSTSTHNLGETTVTASHQFLNTVGSVYIPSGRQRVAASDGITLLARMHIPQLDVSPTAGTAKTAEGQSVDFFINYRPASREDVAGLHPADVRRVEYFDFPPDPRFRRAQHVVNFVTQAYSYGGYSKISGKERFLVRSGDVSAYSKLSHKAMEYDFMLSGSGDRNTHVGNLSSESYRFTDRTTERHNTVQTSRHRKNGLFSGLRASWRKNDSLSVRNLLSVRKERVPVNTNTGTVCFSGQTPAETFISSSESSGTGYEWNGEAYAAFGKGWTLNGDMQTEIRTNTTADSYTAAVTDITSHAREHGWSVRGDIRLNKTISEKISLFASFITGDGRTRICYSGTDAARNKFRQTFSGPSLGISFSTKILSGNADAGLAAETNTINGTTARDRYPFTHVSLRYAADQKNAFGLWFQYASMSPDAAMKSPNTIQQNELMTVAGNPVLRNARHISSNVNYTFLHSDRCQLSIYTTFFRIAGRQAPVYTPDDKGQTMLKRYDNDGDYNHGQAGARLSISLLGGRLAATLAPRILLYHVTGSSRTTHTCTTCSASADYYIGAFRLDAGWNARSSYVDGETCFLRKFPADYSLGVGWTYRGWNIGLSAVNFLRSSWTLSRDNLNTRWYDCRTTQLGATSHRRIALSLTYTLRYGRRIDNDNELRDSGGSSSSILK